MTFNSFEYALFLPIVLLVYWRLSHRGQNLLLLVASYVFYAAWDYRFLGLLALSTVVDFAVARAMASAGERGRRGLLLVSLGTNLGILATFKYFNFFVDSAAELLASVGLETSGPVLEVALPVGISFYTFQTLSYTFDVFRGQRPATDNLLNFGVYVAFFPQLVAGPIERSRRLLPRIESERPRPGRDAIASGVGLILLGLFRKVVIADGLAPFVEQIFGQAAEVSAATALIGVWAFAFQIYADFAGYTDIARGSARLLGIELMQNFRQPYLSTNVTAFWRTWHISLSTWLRDYLYVPLGGNRGGRLRTYRNLMVTMLLGGLWHGAAWTFVVWGGLHGAFLGIHRAFGRRPDGDAAPRFGPRSLLPAFVTFNVVGVAWIFFRASSFEQATQMLRAIGTLRGGFFDLDAAFMVAVAGAATLLIDIAQRNRGMEFPVLAWPAAARGLAYGAMLTAIVAFSGSTVVPFLYFQF